MRRKRLLAIVLPATLLLASVGVGASSLTACGNGSSSGAGGGGDCPDPSFDGTTPTATFATDVLPIFRQSCGLSTSCHGMPGGGALPGQHYYGPANSDPAPSAADIATILAGAVGVTSAEEPDMDIIKAGDPANSYMMYKLDADPTSGPTCATLTCVAGMSCLLAMPSGGPQLPQATRDTIRRWIAQGAKND